MNLQHSSYKAQSDFAGYCRTGDLVEIEGTLPEGLKQYRRLVFGVVNDAIENSFPITHKYLHTEIWDEMIDLFFRNHKCQSFQVWNIAGEFYEYAHAENWAKNYDFEALNNLLLFEWTETEMYNMKDSALSAYKPSGDFLTQLPVFNPEFKFLKFEFPVHRTQPHLAAKQKGEYFVLCYRDLQSGNINFMDLSVFRIWMIEQMIVYGKSLDQTLLVAGSIFGELDSQIIQTSIDFLKHLYAKGFLLGFTSAEMNN